MNQPSPETLKARPWHAFQAEPIRGSGRGSWKAISSGPLNPVQTLRQVIPGLRSPVLGGQNVLASFSSGSRGSKRK